MCSMDLQTRDLDTFVDHWEPLSWILGCSIRIMIVSVEYGESTWAERIELRRMFSQLMKDSCTWYLSIYKTVHGLGVLADIRRRHNHFDHICKKVTKHITPLHFACHCPPSVIPSSTNETSTLGQLDRPGRVVPVHGCRVHKLCVWTDMDILIVTFITTKSLLV